MALDDASEQTLLALYADVDATVASAAPVCHVSGRCCRFKEFGHALFLSEPEAELLLKPGLPEGAVIDEANCPYQIGGLCTARERRPLACRVYFCDPNYADRQVEISEEFLGRLKRWHHATGRPWNYRRLHDFLAEKVDASAFPPAADRPPAQPKLPLIFS